MHECFIYGSENIFSQINGAIGLGHCYDNISWDEVLECLDSDSPIIVFVPAGKRMVLVHDPSLHYSSSRMLEGRYFTKEEITSGEPVMLASGDPFVDRFNSVHGFPLSG